MELSISIADTEALVDALLALEAARVNPDHVAAALDRAYDTLSSLTVAVAQVQDTRALTVRGTGGD
jgi:hypothetical protein